MADRRLVVTEADPTDPHYGEMLALAPNNATGVAIPSFRVGTSLPTVGTTNGEGFYDTTTRQGYVWDGASWRDIAANPIHQFATDADLLADTVAPTGSYAISSSTGNLYIRRPAGWARVGITSYSTVADLLGDAPLQGTLGDVLDEGSLWTRTATGWRCLGPRELADTAAVVAWNAVGSTSNSDQAIALDVGVLYVRFGTAWRPVTIWEDTEANIRAATWALNGQGAIATDTGRTFVRINGAWVEEPIAHYATEALLLAATPPNGTLAWADDTQVAFTRAGGTWHRLAGPQITIGATVPATPGAGDMYMNSTTNVLQVSDGTAWHVPQSPGGVVGDLRQSLLTEAQFTTALGADGANWALADGRSVAGSVYATVTGRNSLPDLRGAFLRMAGTNASNGNWVGGALNGFQEDATARPKHAFTTDSQGSHSHSMELDWWLSNAGGGGGVAYPNRPGSTRTAADGAHTHTITGGGDTETRPKNYSVNYFIKIN